MVQSLLGTGVNILGSLMGGAASSSTTTTPSPSLIDQMGGYVNTTVPHSGRGPYEEADRSRYVDSKLFFSSAHRYHSGVGPNERAAVIRNDESVMTPGQLKQWNEMNSDKEGVTMVNISAVDAKSFVDLCTRNPDVFSGLISKSLKQNKLRNDVKRYGR
jgi:hypothetical protein